MPPFSRPVRTLAPLFVFALLAGCASTKQQAPTAETGSAQPRPEETEVAVPGAFSRPGPGEDITEIDTNGDQRPDMVKIWSGKAPEDGAGGDAGQLLRKEVDLNRDGKVDLWNWYGTEGAVTRQSYDLDFDGRVDVNVFYETGVVVRKEVFHTFADKPDTFKYYEKSKLNRVERDRDGDGRIDTWEYWEGEQIDRIGEDVDGDGNVDKWIKPKQG